MQRKDSNMSLNSADEPTTPLLPSRPLLDTRSMVRHALVVRVCWLVRPPQTGILVV